MWVVGLFFHCGVVMCLITSRIKRMVGGWIMAQLYKGRQLPTNRINLQIWLPSIQCRSNAGAVDNLTEVICKDLECHGMTNMFSKTNKMAMVFMRLRGKAWLLTIPIVYRLPEIEV